MYINEIVKTDFKYWGGNDEVYIQTPTGSGKTTFVAEILANYATQIGMEVLLLVNRKILKNQIKRKLIAEHGANTITDKELDEIQCFNGITILSYQELQEELKRKGYPLATLYEDRFRFIVFDEIHYLLQDSTFNRNIYYLLRAIPYIQNATKIFMSATLDEVYSFLWKVMHKDDEIPWFNIKEKARSVCEYQETIFTRRSLFYYYIKPQYEISRVQYLQKLDEIGDLINSDETDEKWLIFVNSKREAEKLKKEIVKEQVYLDADVDEEDDVKQGIINQSRFQAKVMITTKVLDNGINLIDRSLKNIVLLTTEKTEFIQMLGRKRFIDKDDEVRILIMRRDVRFFNGMRNKKLMPITKFFEDIHQESLFTQERFDEDEFVELCRQMVIIREGRIEVSKAAEQKIKLDMKFHNYIIEKLKEDPDAFIKEQLSWLGKEGDFSPTEYHNYNEHDNYYKKIYNFLEDMVGKRMNKTEQSTFRNEFRNLVSNYGETLTDRKERIPGKSKINDFCKKKELPFHIISIDNSRFWVVEEDKNDERMFSD